ncbi:MAG: DUF4956 domain-containing protein [Planctomycetia bacterium]|nr:DUF4956 domain-containing protein [Planctomycetia bacterium]
MPDWLAPDLAGQGPNGIKVLAVRLGLSLLFGGIVAVVYRASHGREKADDVTLQATLVLLCMLIAMVSLVIGSDIARAFSLVGALSIVRFRTVVDDTRDTAFVIFAVIVGMAVGSGQYLVPAVGVPAVGLVAVGLHRLQNGNGGLVDGMLTVRIGLGRDAESLLAAPLDRHVVRRRLLSVGTTKQGAALELGYAVRLKSEAGLSGLVTELNQVEGIQSVEVRRAGTS